MKIGLAYQKIIVFFIGAAVGGWVIFINTQLQTGKIYDERAPHPQIEVSADLPAPQITLDITKDSKDGVNVSINATDFTVNPQAAKMMHTPEMMAMMTPSPNEGHYHLYINNRKIMRLYGNSAHIPADWLRNGTNIITVTLSANNHAHWMLGGVDIGAEQVIEFEKE